MALEIQQGKKEMLKQPCIHSYGVTTAYTVHLGDFLQDGAFQHQADGGDILPFGLKGDSWFKRSRAVWH